MEKKKLFTSFLISLFFTFNLIIFGPLELYLTNINELWFSIGDLIPVVLVCGALVFIIIFCVCMIPLKKYKILHCLIFGTALGFYVQGNLMSVSYGVLDGRQIDWNSYTYWGLINTLIWLLCIISPFLILKFKKELIHNFINFGSCFIILIQMVTLIILLFTTPLEKDNAFYLSNEDMLTISDTQNALVFILDTFDAEYFRKIQDTNPEFIKPLEGFTYFNNVAGSYPTTKGAMPFILTGQYYENEQTYTDYINGSNRDNSFYNDLYNKGFDVRIFTDPLFLSQEYSDNIGNVVRNDLKISSTQKLLKLIYKFTLFRYSPHFIKKYFWFYSGEFDNLKSSNENTEEEFDYNNLSFYNLLIEQGISKEKNKGCFRLYHLSGVHPPYNMNANNKLIEDGSITDFEQAQGCLNIVYEYIRQLKELKIYSNTTIIITADHGNAVWKPTMPLMLVKPQSTDTGFNISNAPVSQADIRATIFSEIDDKMRQFGSSMFDIPENAERERRYLYYTWDDSWDKEYLPDMTEYIIEGVASDLNQYRPTGKTYTSEGNVEKTIKFGEELTFDKTSIAKKFYYWWQSEGDFAWSNGKSNRFFIKFKDNPAHNLLATFNFKMVHNAPQRLVVKCKDMVLFDETIVQPGEIEFGIPRDLIDNKGIDLTFEYPSAVSPASLGNSKDKRILAFAFTSMKFEEDKQ